MAPGQYLELTSVMSLSRLNKCLQYHIIEYNKEKVREHLVSKAAVLPLSEDTVNAMSKNKYIYYKLQNPIKINNLNYLGNREEDDLSHTF